MAIHQAALIADWGDVTLFTDGRVLIDDEARVMLRRHNVTIEATPVKALEGRSPALDGVRLVDGRFIAVAAVFVGYAL